MMFNLLVSGNANAWETDQLMRMDLDRFLKYSGSEVLVVNKSDPGTLKALEGIDSLLMYELGADGPMKDVVRLGRISDIRIDGNKVVFRFEEEARLPRAIIVAQERHLGMDHVEQNHNHWAVKDGSIPGAVRATAKKTRRVSKERRTQMPDPRSVFVVHGRDHAVRDAVFEFLSALDLKPLEWEALVGLTGKASPYIGDVLKAGFEKAQAAVVVLTGDDEARLRPDLVRPKDPPYERELTRQARPNVLLEAGMALGLFEDRTIILEFGELRPVSDTMGRHVVRMSNSPESRKVLVNRLKTAKCAVDDTGTEWLRRGNFEVPMPAVAPGPAAVPNELDQRQIDVLLLALYKGQDIVDRSIEGMQFIQVGDVGLLDEDDEEVRVDYITAYHELLRMKLVAVGAVGQNKMMAYLTEEGKAKAGQLRAKGAKVSRQFPEVPRELR